MKIIKGKVAALAAVLVLGGATLPPVVRVLADPAQASAAGAQTVVLQHIVPTDIVKSQHWDQTANLPAGVTQIEAIPVQNALVVIATPAGLAKVREIVKTLDIEPRQLQIKFTLGRASDADLKASGLDFQLAPLTEPDLKPLFLIYATGSPAVRLLQTLTKQGAVTQEPDITTTNNVTASFNLDAGAAGSTELSVTPRLNGDASVTLALHPAFSMDGVKYEVNTLRTVKNGDTLVIVMPPAVPQSEGKNLLLLFVTPTVK